MKLLVVSAVLLAALSTLAMGTELNHCSQAELEQVPGVGPALSGRILAAKAQGAFRGWPDLQRRVPGLGHSLAARMSAAGWTVGGEGYAAAETAARPGQPKKRATSSRLDQASDSPSAISARVNGASNSR